MEKCQKVVKEAKNGLKGEKWEIRFCEVCKFCVKKSDVQ